MSGSQTTIDTTAPCPACRTEMVLAAVTPHPIATQLARHTYLCAACNQTKTYVLPANLPPGAPAEHEVPPEAEVPAAGGASSDRRAHPREQLDAPATIYDKEGRFLLPCILRDLSKSGGRIEVLQDATLPQYFLLSMLPDGSARRLCSKVWQVAHKAGVRFVERNRM